MSSNNDANNRALQQGSLRRRGATHCGDTPRMVGVRDTYRRRGATQRFQPTRAYRADTTQQRAAKREEKSYYECLFDVRGRYEFGGFIYSFSETDSVKKGLSFDLDKIPVGAVVRTRKEGDKFKRYGGGTKSLSDYLTDKKIPLYMRDKLLLIAKDSVVYAVLGVEVSDEVKIDENTKKIYLIEIGESK